MTSAAAAEVAAALQTETEILVQLSSHDAQLAAALRQSRDAAAATEAEIVMLQRQPAIAEIGESDGGVQLRRPQARRGGKSLRAAADANHSSSLHSPPRAAPRLRRLDDGLDTATFETREGAAAAALPLAARPTRSTDADRNGRAAKSVRFTTAAEDGGDAAFPVARGPAASSSAAAAAARASPSVAAGSLPRGSSPIPAPRPRLAAAALAAPGGSSAYGQALLTYGAGGGGGKPPPRRAGAGDAPLHVRPVPSAGSAAAAGGGRRAAAAPRPEDDGVSVASQSSLFGSKLAMSRF